MKKKKPKHPTKKREKPTDPTAVQFSEVMRRIVRVTPQEVKPTKR